MDKPQTLLRRELEPEGIQMSKSTAKPVLATSGQKSDQPTSRQSTEANTTIQYQWSPVSAVAASGSSQRIVGEPHNKSVVILSR
jgi:hypothetical protein